LENSIGWAHDSALTKNYVIIPDGGMHFQLKSLAKGIFFDMIGTLGFTIVPRNTSQEHFVVTSKNQEAVIHIATAWEDEDNIVVACPVSSALQGIAVNKETIQYTKFEFAKMTLPKGPGEIKVEKIDSPQCSPEFPRVNPLLDGGEKVRFCFASCMVPPGDKRAGAVNFAGFAKFDLETMEMVAHVSLPDNWVIGELAPIPKHPDNPRMGGSANEGSDAVWLVGVMIHVETLESRIVMYDGETVSSDPVVVLGSPERIPAGFHSQFYLRSWLEEEGHFARTEKQNEQEIPSSGDEL
jgi:carotenoid cleavage dioxygenase-like enzyme